MEEKSEEIESKEKSVEEEDKMRKTTATQPVTGKTHLPSIDAVYKNDCTTVPRIS